MTAAELNEEWQVGWRDLQGALARPFSDGFQRQAAIVLVLRRMLDAAQQIPTDWIADESKAAEVGSLWPEIDPAHSEGK